MEPKETRETSRVKLYETHEGIHTDFHSTTSQILHMKEQIKEMDEELGEPA